MELEPGTKQRIDPSIRSWNLNWKSESESESESGLGIPGQGRTPATVRAVQLEAGCEGPAEPSIRPRDLNLTRKRQSESEEVMPVRGTTPVTVRAVDREARRKGAGGWPLNHAQESEPESEPHIGIGFTVRIGVFSSGVNPQPWCRSAARGGRQGHGGAVVHVAGSESKPDSE